MTVMQCRMARAGLGWSLAELAVRSRIARRTIARFEAGEAVKLETVEALRTALIAGGAVFVEQAGKLGVLVAK